MGARAAVGVDQQTCLFRVAATRYLLRVRIIDDNLAAFVALQPALAAAEVRYAMGGTIGLQAHGIRVVGVCQPDIVVHRSCRHGLQLLRDHGWATEHIGSTTTDIHLLGSDPADSLTWCFDSQPELTDIVDSATMMMVAGHPVPVLPLAQIAAIHLLSERGRAAILATQALEALPHTGDVHHRLRALQGIEAGNSRYVLRSFNRTLAATRLAAFEGAHARV
jgi:hypothetical protein